MLSIDEYRSNQCLTGEYVVFPSNCTTICQLNLMLQASQEVRVTKGGAAAAAGS